MAVNEEQFDRVAAKIADLVGGDLTGRRIALWGLTFKARTDDRRESPALHIARRLLAAGAQLQAHDPTVGDGPLAELPEVVVSADPYAACEGAEALVVLTEWDEFRWLDFDKVASVMAAARVMDTRNLLERAALVRRGFDYVGLGR
jgi:UDPglucose 6-dehydrogenase